MNDHVCGNRCQACADEREALDAEVKRLRAALAETAPAPPIHGVGSPLPVLTTHYCPSCERQWYRPMGTGCAFCRELLLAFPVAPRSPSDAPPTEEK